MFVVRSFFLLLVIYLFRYFVNSFVLSFCLYLLFRYLVISSGLYFFM